jgi:hypothetical protein
MQRDLQSLCSPTQGLPELIALDRRQPLVTTQHDGIGVRQHLDETASPTQITAVPADEPAQAAMEFLVVQQVHFSNCVTSLQQPTSPTPLQTAPFDFTPLAPQGRGAGGEGLNPVGFSKTSQMLGANPAIPIHGHLCLEPEIR